MQSGKLLSIQVGKVQRLVMPEAARVDFQHPFWTTGIFKSPIAGPIQVTQDSLEGDQQADLKHHGGPDNIILAYDADHYPVWQKELNMPDLPYGAFGENFTVTGFTDTSVCIGDIWKVGDQLTLQITQPRQPCFKLARRLRQPDIIKMVHDTSWGGWYLRVLTPGPAQAGMPIQLTARPHPDWPIDQSIQLMYHRKNFPDQAAALAQLPELSARWKIHLTED